MPFDDDRVWPGSPALLYWPLVYSPYAVHRVLGITISMPTEEHSPVCLPCPQPSIAMYGMPLARKLGNCSTGRPVICARLPPTTMPACQFRWSENDARPGVEIS